MELADLRIVRSLERYSHLRIPAAGRLTAIFTEAVTRQYDAIPLYLSRRRSVESEDQCRSGSAALATGPRWIPFDGLHSRQARRSHRLAPWHVYQHRSGAGFQPLWIANRLWPRSGAQFQLLLAHQIPGAGADHGVRPDRALWGPAGHPAGGKVLWGRYVLQPRVSGFPGRTARSHHRFPRGRQRAAHEYHRAAVSADRR